MLDVRKTLGALLVGGLVASVFSGIVIVQTFSYFRTYPRDSAKLKSLVAAVCILDLFHTIFVGMSLWDYLIDYFGVVSRADYVPWSLAFTIVVTAILTFLVHCFFVHRIYKLSMANFFIAVPLGCIAIARLGSACLTSGKMIQLRSLKAFVSQSSWSFTLGLGLSSLLDALITGFLCYLLTTGRKKNSSINHILDSIMLYAFELGALTSAAAVASMVCWIAMPTNLIFMGLHFVIAKFYANSLLATLNTRNHLRAPSRSPSTSGERIYFPESRRVSKRISGGPEITKVGSLQIKIEEVTTRTIDATNYRDSKLNSCHLEVC